MAIDLSLAFSVTTGTASSNTIIAVPSGTQDGEFLLSLVSNRMNATEDHSIALPGGWTSILESVDPVGRVANVHLAYRRAASEPANYTWTHDTVVDFHSGFIWRLTGVKASGSPIGASQVTHDNVGASTFDAAGITTTADGSAVVAIRVHRNAGLAVSNAELGGSAITTRQNSDDPAGKAAVFADIKASAGATGNFTGTDNDNDRTLIVLELLAAGGASSILKAMLGGRFVSGR